MIEIYQLHQLLAFAEYGTLSKAAEALHLSQPALSRSMQNLEESLQVTLFHRTKNRIVLNDNGNLTVNYAKRIIEQIDEMNRNVRAFDRSNHTIFIGSCAPAPLWHLLPAMTKTYPDMTISSEIKKNDVLMESLKNSTYRLIILPFPVEDANYVCQKYMDEQLYLSVVPSHHLAKKSEVCFSDFDGENMILFSDIGFWHDVPTSKMPHSRFLIQNERFAFDELLNSSVLPAFSSNLAVENSPHQINGRISIPITDPEAKVSYYLVCRKEHSCIMKGFITN